VHTQRQLKSYAITNALDSISKEKRLVVLAVAKLDYLISDNQKLSRINHSLNEINERNAVYIVQIEGLNKELNDELNAELKRKKKWRNATLYSVGFNAAFLTALIVLGR
jgi:hypothetical protein